ncbi:MAG TPA: peptidoglycan-binding domain-containing protein [Acetobacteraceae bacterium]|nr:peptidoglycan-binding domain-containing protein [Acetobacteraceae bacterium]
MSLFDDAPRAAPAVAVLVALNVVPGLRAAEPADKGWICGNGPGQGARCLEVARPADAALRVARGGVCPRGELPFGGVCYVLVIPPHAELDASGHTWSCRAGFSRSGAACLPDGNDGTAGARATAPVGSVESWKVDVGRADGGLAAGRSDPTTAPARDLICRAGYYVDGLRCRPLPVAAIPAPPAAPPATERDREGETAARPATIERVQRALAALGFDPGAVDGVVGERTREALRAYQARKGLPVTGQTSQDLISALDADFLHCAVWLPLARSTGIPDAGPCRF